MSDKKYAIFSVLAFAILPFTLWLSAAIVALVTLRKGKEAGMVLLMPAMVVSMAYMSTFMPWEIALMNALLRYIPVFCGACILRSTASWPLVFGSFPCFAIGISLILEWMHPGLIADQFNQFQGWLSKYPELAKSTAIHEKSAFWGPASIGHLIYGMQTGLIFLMVTGSLLFARFVQSKLFAPGEFRKEVAGFRSGKVAVFFLLVLSICLWLGMYLAIDLLPLMCLYFLISGINLSCVFLAKKTMAGFFVAGVTLFIIYPVALVMIFMVMGILDGICNFRVFFSGKKMHS